MERNALKSLNSNNNNIITETTVSNRFNLTDESHLYKDSTIYIEFTKNDDNNTNCCIYLTNTNNRLFFTPPNY